MAAITYITTLNVGPGSVGGEGVYLGVYGDVNVDGTVCATCFCGAGAGASDMWADGTNPYIVPCNSCGVCVIGASVFAGCLTAATYLYVCSGAYFLGGSINMCGNDLLFVDYLDGTCVCASAKLVLPVGTNCY